MIFHCLNRGNDRRELFSDDADYAAFERVLESALEAVPVRLLAYRVMPNHWHLLPRPRKVKGSPQERGMMSQWPVKRRADWLAWVNEPQTATELAALRESARRGRPFGGPAWQAETAASLRLQSTFRPPGRPKKKQEPEEGKKPAK